MNYFTYFTEIEDEFVKRRGSHILVSPLDWSLIETWRQRGIPLQVALRGIHASFDSYDRLPKRGRKVNSLFYCEQEVEALFQQYRESRTGSNEHGGADSSGLSEPDKAPIATEAIAAYLDERRLALEKLSTQHSGSHILAETFSRSAGRLSDLIKDLVATGLVSGEQLESDLIRVEEIILEGLRASLTADEMTRIQREAARQLKSYKDAMGPDVYEQTLQNYLARRWRERFQVPRLSLFYMS